MGSAEKLPAIAMVLLQCVYATMALLNRAALVKGMSPRVFIFYRQAIATLVFAPLAFFTTRGNSSSSRMGFKSFLLIFITAFIGVVLNQTLYFEGLYLASSSIASAMSNLVPAVTFLAALIFGLEQVNLKRLSSIAKIVGTMFCVGGAISMALIKGPKLLMNNSIQLPQSNSMVLETLQGQDDARWLLGCLSLFASMCCWAFWLILQVAVTATHPNHLSLSAWLCFLAMLQSGAIAFFLEKDHPNSWILTSPLELTCCLFSGVFGSGVLFFVQAWCVSKRGPLYSAMFNPLCTVITAVLASLFLHEDIYFGSLLGAVAVIIGLYVVLWGKAEEMKAKSDCLVKPTQEKIICKVDLEQPLLDDHSNVGNQAE